MNINLHIERVVLDGLPVAEGQSALVRTAMEAELAGLLAGSGVTGQSSSALASVSGGTIEIQPGVTARQLGRKIGRNVYASLKQSRPASQSAKHAAPQSVGPQAPGLSTFTVNQTNKTTNGEKYA